MEMIKRIVRIGNSAGVILPREWLNGKARVELLEKPLDIKKDILDILEPYLEDILGIYLVGSYARNEQTEKSDVDILAITNNINKKIERGKYAILLIGQKNVENNIKINALPIIPMLREARTIINSDLIEKYKNLNLTRKNLKWYVEQARSALKINKEFIELDKKDNSKTNNAVAYSLILNLRSVYIIDCLIKNKMWSIKEFLGLINRISGSLNAYEGYLRIKNNENIEIGLPVEEAEKLYNYIAKKIKEHEKWLKLKR